MNDKLGLTPAALAALAKGDMDNFIAAATPGGIRQQEADGQRDFVANSTLPIKINSGTKEQFEQMGIVFGDPVDDLFRIAQLPDGWEKVPTDHSMWSKLIDKKRRERASIFYKAAFYDRDAFLNITRRFSYGVIPVNGYDDPDYEYNTTPRKAAVFDCEKIIWESEPMEIAEGTKPYAVSDALAPLGAGWLFEHYPDWENPLAYWDE